MLAVQCMMCSRCAVSHALIVVLRTHVRTTTVAGAAKTGAFRMSLSLGRPEPEEEDGAGVARLATMLDVVARTGNVYIDRASAAYRAPCTRCLLIHTGRTRGDKAVTAPGPGVRMCGGGGPRASAAASCGSPAPVDAGHSAPHPPARHSLPSPPRARDGTGQDRTGLGITRGGTVWPTGARRMHIRARPGLDHTGARARPGAGEAGNDETRGVGETLAGLCVSRSLAGSPPYLVEVQFVWTRCCCGEGALAPCVRWHRRCGHGRRTRAEENEGGLPAVTPRQGRRKRAV